MSKDLDRRSLIAKGALTAAVMTLLGEPRNSFPQSSKPESQTGVMPEKIPQELQEAIKRITKDDSTEAESLSLDPNISRDENPSSHDQQLWDKINEQMIADYATDIFGDLKTPVPSKFLEIDNFFSFDTQDCDAVLRYQHVEHLLDQTSDLLGRGLQSRDEWDDLAAKTFNVAMDLREYDELYKIHQEEVKAGFYTLPYKESFAELAAQSSTKAAYVGELIWLNWLVDQKYTVAEMNAQSGYAQCLAYLSQFEHASTQFNWSGSQNTVAEHAKLAAFGESFGYLYTQLGTLTAQKLVAIASSQAAQNRLTGLSTRNAWDLRDADFKRRRSDVARLIADYKSKAFTDSSGALNYPRKMIYIRELFARDFRDALARLYSAAEGLRRIYGYSYPLPQSLDRLRKKMSTVGTSPKYFADCLIWVRDAISWLTCFSQLDQNYVYALSLRELMTKKQWDAGKKLGDWKFDVANTLFPDQRHVRLRGISAAVVVKKVDEEDLQGVWRTVIDVPRNSYCVHLSGETVDLDQSQIPACRLARVSTREAAQEADITGAVALHNASPFGSWRLRIGKKSTAGVNVGELKDINLDLHMAVRSI
jgi:hypothetical protein